MNVLIVEDEPLVMRALVRALESRGHTCFMAPTLAIADVFLDKVAVDVVVCDRDLDGEDGWTWAANSKHRVVRMTGGHVEPKAGVVFRKGAESLKTLITMVEAA